MICPERRSLLLWSTNIEARQLRRQSWVALSLQAAVRMWGEASGQQHEVQPP